MAMPTSGRPNDCVNFGDAWSMGDVSIAAWVARRFKDPVAQYVATEVGELRSHYSIIWLDTGLAARKPGADLLDVRFSNDWIIARSGWNEAEGLVAMRSGGPANHEHADRNSVIFKAYGERLFHDPYRAAYSHTEPHWLLRLTGAHTAVLIDGKGHQYHDGHEGTNASWAEARVVNYTTSARTTVVTSDATEAYRLVNADVLRVDRTLVYLKPDTLVILDRISLKENPVPVQLRFQIDNSDGKGRVGSEGSGFHVERPGASLKAAIYAAEDLKVRTGTLNVPEDKGIHPFAEAETGTGREHTVLSVCTAQKAGETHGVLSVRLQEETWRVQGTHNGRTISVVIDAGEAIPSVTFG
jgi:hypothetical protein